jgi:hypothetical protein
LHAGDRDAEVVDIEVGRGKDDLVERRLRVD